MLFAVACSEKSTMAPSKPIAPASVCATVLSV